jgi:hypothetical protein
MFVVVCNCSKSFIKKNKDIFIWNDSPLTNGKKYEVVRVIDTRRQNTDKRVKQANTAHRLLQNIYPLFGQTSFSFHFPNSINYVIIDNTGKENIYPAKLFIPLSEWRQKQMDSILE